MLEPSVVTKNVLLFQSANKTIPCLDWNELKDSTPSRIKATAETVDERSG